MRYGDLPGMLALIAPRRLRLAAWGVHHHVDLEVRCPRAIPGQFLLDRRQRDGAGRVDLAAMVTHRFKLGQMMEAYDTFGRAAETKALKVAIAR